MTKGRKKTEISYVELMNVIEISQIIFRPLHYRPIIRDSSECLSFLGCRPSPREHGFLRARFSNCNVRNVSTHLKKRVLIMEM